MSPHEISRLERLEQFVERLTLGSYIAKAASEGTKILGSRHLLEQGEQVLAKAATAYTSAESLLALGEREISDVTQMGVFAGHIAAGDLNAARNVLIDNQERTRFAKAADAAQEVNTVLGDDDLATFDTHRAVSELRAKFGSIEQALTSIEDRLGQLEARPVAVPAPAPSAATVAKATSTKKARPQTREEDAQSLMNDVERYIDDPSAIGALSSLIQAGDFAKARPAIERARQAHETEKIKSERRGFTR